MIKEEYWPMIFKHTSGTLIELKINLSCSKSYFMILQAWCWSIIVSYMLSVYIVFAVV